MTNATYKFAADLIEELTYEWHTLRELGPSKLQVRDCMYRVMYYDSVTMETPNLVDACEEFASNTVHEREYK